MTNLELQDGDDVDNPDDEDDDWEDDDEDEDDEDEEEDVETWQVVGSSWLSNALTSFLEPA